MKATRLTVQEIVNMKRAGKRIAAITAYDYTAARALDAAAVPVILVGDTLGIVVQGEETTLGVSLEQIIYHSKLVARGARHALIIGDMPFMSYQASIEDGVRNAGRLIAEGRVGAVKVEGGAAVIPVVEAIVKACIPVCGHLGFTPQATHAIGRPKIQGRNPRDAANLVKEAELLEAAGVFAVVLELVPATVAKEISSRISIPTIGIGAGPHCDGEVQVFHDLFGLYKDFVPRHTHRYLDLAELISSASRRYVQDVTDKAFPGPEQTVDLTPEEQARFSALLAGSMECHSANHPIMLGPHQG